MKNICKGSVKLGLQRPHKAFNLKQLQFSNNNIYVELYMFIKSWKKLDEVIPIVAPRYVSPTLSRRDSVVISRLSIGHTRITHSFLFNKTDVPQCTTCHTSQTVKHLLLHCNRNNSVKTHNYQ